MFNFNMETNMSEETKKVAVVSLKQVDNAFDRGFHYFYYGRDFFKDERGRYCCYAMGGEFVGEVWGVFPNPSTDSTYIEVPADFDESTLLD